jgi:hypothetical protein
LAHGLKARCPTVSGLNAPVHRRWRYGGQPSQFSDRRRHVGLLLLVLPHGNDPRSSGYRQDALPLSYGREFGARRGLEPGSPACRAGALATKITKRVWCSLQDSNLGMSVCKTDALAAWRSEQIWCTREDLNLHAARAAASEAARSAVSPRVRSWCRNGGSNAGFRLTKAVSCHWTITAQISACACWRTRTSRLSLTRRVLCPMS